jgi:hypothetical protein
MSSDAPAQITARVARLDAIIDTAMQIMANHSGTSRKR